MAFWSLRASLSRRNGSSYETPLALLAIGGRMTDKIDARR